MKEREANAGGYDASRDTEVCSPSVAAIQDKAAGDPLSKTVGEVLHRYDVLSDDVVAWIHLCPSLHRWVRVRQVLPFEVKGGRLPGTTWFHPRVRGSGLADFGWRFGAGNKALAGRRPGLSDPPDADGAL